MNEQFAISTMSNLSQMRTCGIVKGPGECCDFELISEDNIRFPVHRCVVVAACRNMAKTLVDLKLKTLKLIGVPSEHLAEIIDCMYGHKYSGKMFDEICEKLSMHGFLDLEQRLKTSELNKNSSVCKNNASVIYNTVVVPAPLENQNVHETGRSSAQQSQPSRLIETEPTYSSSSVNNMNTSILPQSADNQNISFETTSYTGITPADSVLTRGYKRTSLDITEDVQRYKCRKILPKPTNISPGEKQNAFPEIPSSPDVNLSLNQSSCVMTIPTITLTENYKTLETVELRGRKPSKVSEIREGKKNSKSEKCSDLSISSIHERACKLSPLPIEQHPSTCFCKKSDVPGEVTHKTKINNQTSVCTPLNVTVSESLCSTSTSVNLSIVTCTTSLSTQPKCSYKTNTTSDISSPENHSVPCALYNRVHLGQNGSLATISLSNQNEEVLTSSLKDDQHFDTENKTAQPMVPHGVESDYNMEKSQPLSDLRISEVQSLSNMSADIAARSENTSMHDNSLEMGRKHSGIVAVSSEVQQNGAMHEKHSGGTVNIKDEPPREADVEMSSDEITDTLESQSSKIKSRSVRREEMTDHSEKVVAHNSIDNITDIDKNVESTSDKDVMSLWYSCDVDNNDNSSSCKDSGKQSVSSNFEKVWNATKSCTDNRNLGSPDKDQRDVSITEGEDDDIIVSQIMNTRLEKNSKKDQKTNYQKSEIDCTEILEAAEANPQLQDCEMLVSPGSHEIVCIDSSPEDSDKGKIMNLQPQLPVISPQKQPPKIKQGCIEIDKLHERRVRKRKEKIETRKIDEDITFHSAEINSSNPSNVLSSAVSQGTVSTLGVTDHHVNKDKRMGNNSTSEKMTSSSAKTDTASELKTLSITSNSSMSANNTQTSKNRTTCIKSSTVVTTPYTVPVDVNKLLTNASLQSNRIQCPVQQTPEGYVFINQAAVPKSCVLVSRNGQPLPIVIGPLGTNKATSPQNIIHQTLPQGNVLNNPHMSISNPVIQPPPEFRKIHNLRKPKQIPTKKIQSPPDMAKFVNIIPKPLTPTSQDISCPSSTK